MNNDANSSPPLRFIYLFAMSREIDKNDQNMKPPREEITTDIGNMNQAN